MEEYRLNVFKKASFCRHFENEVYRNIQNKNIKFPAYLSAGQEFISASIATILEDTKPAIFIQHRGHSVYLSFGGDPVQLIDELLGRKTGCAGGMGGSASIQSVEKNIFGHDGLMGSQVPIAVGYCYQTKRPTVVFMGDASAEEDFVLGALGWASTKQLPILFVVEDNNLSILTPKNVRRNWGMDEVAKAFKMRGFNSSDNPLEIDHFVKRAFANSLAPMLINVNTTRKYWHAGAGTDGDSFDRYEEELKELQAYDIDLENKKIVSKLWQQQLEKQ